MSEMAGLYCKCRFHFLRNCQTVFQFGTQITPPTLGMHSLFDFSHLSGYIAASYFDFNLHFPENI